MRKTTSAEPALPVLTRSCRSLARNAASKPGWLVIVGLCMVGLPDLEEQIHARVIRADGDLIRGGLMGPERVKLPSGSIDQMPVKQVFHSLSPRIGWFNVREQQQSAGSDPIIQNVRQGTAHEVRQVVEQPGAINKIIQV